MLMLIIIGLIVLGLLIAPEATMRLGCLVMCIPLGFGLFMLLAVIFS
jgi:hypothetical protein